jgi:hypothetical protein
VLIGLPAGKWQFKVRYQDPRQVVGASSRSVTATIGPNPGSSAAVGSSHVRRGALTLDGALSPAASAGSKVELLALNTSPGAPARFRVLNTAVLSAGARTVTLHTRLKRGSRWVLQLEYVQSGQAGAFSGLRTVAVSQGA